MRFSQKIAASFLIVFLCVVSVQAARHFLVPKTALTKNARAIMRSKGNPSAPLWLVEFSDFQCPSCRSAWAFLDTLVRRYPKKVYFQARFYPLAKHPYGFKSALCAECAARQGRFWGFYNQLFDKQPAWTHAVVSDIDAVFERYAQSAGMDVGRFKSCIRDPRTMQVILQELEDAKSMGVVSTPTFFVNGKMIAGERLLKEELRKYFPDLETDKK